MTRKRKTPYNRYRATYKARKALERAFNDGSIPLKGAEAQIFDIYCCVARGLRALEDLTADRRDRYSREEAGDVKSDNWDAGAISHWLTEFDVEQAKYWREALADAGVKVHKRWKLK